jgi:DNA-3-methyladenine glycosylase I
LRSLPGEPRNREFGTFNRYLWAFVDHELIVNALCSLKDLPPETALSRTLSKDLVTRGFSSSFGRRSFAFMQPVDACLVHEDVSVFHKLS